MPRTRSDKIEETNDSSPKKRTTKWDKTEKQSRSAALATVPSSLNLKTKTAKRKLSKTSTERNEEVNCKKSKGRKAAGKTKEPTPSSSTAKEKTVEMD